MPPFSCSRQKWRPLLAMLGVPFSSLDDSSRTPPKKIAKPKRPTPNYRTSPFPHPPKSPSKSASSSTPSNRSTEQRKPWPTTKRSLSSKSYCSARSSWCSKPAKARTSPLAGCTRFTVRSVPSATSRSWTKPSSSTCARWWKRGAFCASRAKRKRG
uniref:(northern house mosquito) hypothetical protein n=1 Tax=Culex pipiens TaxID=7175 RepID=A0A8D8MPP3_CULPI